MTPSLDTITLPLADLNECLSFWAKMVTQLEGDVKRDRAAGLMHTADAEEASALAIGACIKWLEDVMKKGSISSLDKKG